MHELVVAREFVVLPGEEFLLVVVAGTPGEDRCEVELFAGDLADHVFGVYAFSGLLIVGAAGGVNVRVARIPAVLGGVDPALELDCERGGGFGVDVELGGLGYVFRAAAGFERVVAVGEGEGFAVDAIDLGLEEEVWDGALGGVGVEAIAAVVDG